MTAMWYNSFGNHACGAGFPVRPKVVVDVPKFGGGLKGLIFAAVMSLVVMQGFEF